jgi:translocation and assembly module TamB
MRIQRKIFLFSLLFGVALIAAAVFLLSDKGLNVVARPLLVQFAAGRLNADVEIGWMARVGHSFELGELSIVRVEEFQLNIPAVQIDFTLAGLLNRRVDLLYIQSPDLIIEEMAERTDEPFLLPEAPPFAVDHLLIDGGRLELTAAGVRQTLREVELELVGQAPFGFRLSAFLGETTNFPLFLSGQGSWGRDLSLSFVRVDWDRRPLLTEPLFVTVTRDGGASGRGGVRLDRFDRSHLDQFSAALGRPSPLPPAWTLDLDGPEVDFALEKEKFTLRLQVPQATVGPPERILPLEEVSLEISRSQGVWAGGGAFRPAGQGSAEVQASWAEEKLNGRISIPLTDPGAFLAWLQNESGSRKIAGELMLEADFSLQGEDWVLRGSAGGKKGNQASGYVVQLAPLSASFDLQGSGRAWSGKGRLDLRGRTVATATGKPERMAIRLQPVGQADLAAVAPGLPIPAFVEKIEGVTGTALVSRGGDGAWTGEAKLSAQEIAFGGGMLTDVSFSGRSQFAERSLRADLSGRLAGDSMPEANLAAAGTVSFWGEDYHIIVDVLTVEELAYMAADGMAGLAGGEIRARGKAVAGGERLQVDLAADFRAGEMLWGSLYADLSSLEGTLGLRGDYDFDSRTVAARELTLTVADVGTVYLSGSVSAEAAELQGKAEFPDLVSAHIGLFQPLLATGLPSIAELQPTGSLDLSADLQRQGDLWHLRGDIRPQGVNVSLSDGEAKGIRGRIPFDLRMGPGVEDPAAAEKTGEISLDGLRLGPLTMNPATLGLSSTLNRMTLHNPLILYAAGGSVEIAALRASLTEGRPDIAARVRVEGVDLEALTRQLDLPRMTGRIGADLGEIHYHEGVLRAPGTAGINAFGGSILVSNMSFEAPFSPYSTFHADIDFTGINLHQLTRTFAFGEMNGIVDGYIHDLRLFGSTPSRFTAAVETRSQGKRNISVKALNNLTLISQGGGISSVLSRGIYRFIDFYRYRKIGFQCSLENDVFQLRGTALSGSEDYLVYGGILPPKIDIIAPNHPISFKEMVKRLGRLDRAGD